MTGKYTLTLELNVYRLQYLTKFLELLDTPGTYVNGEKTLNSIKEQLDTLKAYESPSDYQTTFVGLGTSNNDVI